MMDGAAYSYAPTFSPESEVGLTSVVVVHYLGAEDLFACVDSVMSQDVGAIELIVVDNRSPDGAVSSLSADARLRRVWLPHNTGFAAGANVGVSAARGDVVVLLNPDAVLRIGCLAALRKALEEVDIAVPKVLLRDDPTLLDSCGHDLYPDGLNWCRGRGQDASGRYDEAEDLLLFSGAAVAFRRSALVATGGLDEGFWAYGEDADLGLRAARNGLRCRTAPNAVVTHRIGGSFGRYGLYKAFLVERNRVRVLLVHLPVSWLAAAPLWTAARVLALGALGGVGRGVAGGYSPIQRALLGPALLAAWGASLAQAPGSLARRWALSKRPLDRDFPRRLRESRVGLRSLIRRPASRAPQRSREQTP